MRTLIVALAMLAAPASANPCLDMLDADLAVACLLGGPMIAPPQRSRDAPQRPGFTPDTRFMGDRLMSRTINGAQWVCTYTRGQVIVLPTYQQCPSELPY
jgi:hypothetical protein